MDRRGFLGALLKGATACAAGLYVGGRNPGEPLVRTRLQIALPTNPLRPDLSPLDCLANSPGALQIGIPVDPQFAERLRQVEYPPGRVIGHALAPLGYSQEKDAY